MQHALSARRPRFLVVTTCLTVGLALSAAQAAAAPKPVPLASISDSGKPQLAIAAQVGEEVVSSIDVENRLKFILATTNMASTPDMISHIRPQVVRLLVDERLETQEAAKNNIKITQDDIDKAIASIEQGRGMPAGAIREMLKSRGIREETFISQIRAQLLWNKLLMSKVRPNVHVSETEIALFKGKIPDNKQQIPEPTAPQEYRIGVIALPVDKASREKQMRALSAKLVQQMRSGASFEEISRQFSSSSGGSLETFWVRPAQLEGVVAQVLRGVTAGGVTDPVRTAEGYTIVKVYETRDIGAKSKARKPAEPKPEAKPEVLLKVKAFVIQSTGADPKSDEAARMASAAELATNTGSCNDAAVPSIKSLEKFTVQARLFQDNVPDAARSIVEKLAIGEVSTPVAGPDGVALYVRCDPRDDGEKNAEREQVRNLLIQQKMQLEAQKYLRNLRRETFIDIR